MCDLYGIERRPVPANERAPARDLRLKQLRALISARKAERLKAIAALAHARVVAAAGQPGAVERPDGVAALVGQIFVAATLEHAGNRPPRAGADPNRRLCGSVPRAAERRVAGAPGCPRGRVAAFGCIVSPSLVGTESLSLFACPVRSGPPYGFTYVSPDVRYHGIACVSAELVMGRP